MIRAPPTTELNLKNCWGILCDYATPTQF
jgi:hypothetical protein